MSAEPAAGRPQLTVLTGGLGVPQAPKVTLAEHLAAHPEVVARFRRYRCTEAGPDGCWWWTGALNGDTGHGELKIGQRPGPNGQPIDWVEYAHRIAFVLAGGVITPDRPIVRHLCDESSCTNDRCLTGGGRSENALDWFARRGDPASPLTDRRGPYRRALAIREAIRAAGTHPQDQLRAALAAADAGMPSWRQLSLLTPGQASPDVPT